MLILRAPTSEAVGDLILAHQQEARLVLGVQTLEHPQIRSHLVAVIRDRILEHQRDQIVSEEMERVDRTLPHRQTRFRLVVCKKRKI